MPNGMRSITAPRRYALAVLAIAVAVALKFLLSLVLAEESPFLLFLTAIMISAWLGGLGPGLLATLLAALSSAFFFTSPSFSFVIDSPGKILRLGVFLLEGTMISALAAALHSAKTRAATSAQESVDNQSNLRQSEERFRLLVEGVKDYAIFLLDTEGHIVSWNAGAARIKGYRASEIIGQHFSRFYGPEDIENGKPENELKVAAAEGQYHEEGWRVRKDGSQFFADVVITALRDEADGRLRGFAKVTRDITERRRAEVTIRQLSRQNELILNSAGEGIFGVDANGNTTFVNPAAAELIGWEAAELIGKSMHGIMHHTRADGSHYRSEECPIYAAFRDGQVHRVADEVFWRKDGTSFPVEYISTPIREGNNLVGAVVTFRDITERKRAEGQIRQLNAELERKVIERTEQLEAANKELEAFSYSVSHDLRAPLRSIDGFSQALLEDYADQLDAEGKNFLQRVRAASQRMALLIDDMLKLSRVTRREMRREMVDLSALVRTTGERLQSEHPERRVELRIEDGLTVRADAPLLGIAVENLLNNAWKFTGKQPDAKIEFGAAGEDEGRVVYYVRDNGAGFDMAYADKLFGAFQRLHGATEFEGTGIGLATVQRIVRRHGGRIWAEGAVGGGATFYFTL